MGVIERSKEMVLLSPQEMVFDLLMKVLFHRRRGLSVIGSSSVLILLAKSFKP
jgi:hypothetical protein